MDRIGRISKNGRFVLLVNREEYLEIKGLGYKINDTVMFNRDILELTPEKNKMDENEPDYHSSILWKTAEDFFELQLERNPSILRFKKLVRLNNKLKIKKFLTSAEINLRNAELMRRNKVLENWYTILKEVEMLGYDEKLISNVINFAKYDFRKIKHSNSNYTWTGWGNNLFSLSVLMKKSSNNLTKFNNILQSYLKSQEIFKFDKNEALRDYEL